MTEFERFACYVRNIGTATLSRYGAVLSNHINPAVIEERKLNATSIDVNIWLSRRKLCVSSNFLPADFRKMRTDSFQKSRIIPTIPQSDADCDEVGHQQGHGPSLPANEREGV